jgi:hypothetical protein
MVPRVNGLEMRFTHAPIVAIAALLVACGTQTDASALDRNSLAPISSQPAAPSPSATQAPASPSPEESEPQLPEAGGWTLAQTFGEEGTLTSVIDVAVSHDGFVAVGDHWVGDFTASPHEPRIWTSPDGRSWQEATADFGRDDVQLLGISPLASNELLIMGEVGRAEGSPHLAAWTSADGTTWTEIGVPFGETLQERPGFDAGPRGIVATADSEIWYSANGLDWSLVHDAGGRRYFGAPAAAEEGFALRVYDPDADVNYVLASGDGTTWIESDQAIFGPQMTPYGPDWLSWAYTDDPPTISVLHSANGLDWEPILDVNTLTPEDGPKAGRGMESAITEAWLSTLGEELVVLTLGFNHCCAALPASVGVWISRDASNWEASGLEGGAYVTAAASDGELVVLAGQLGRGQEAAFWVGER